MLELKYIIMNPLVNGSAASQSYHVGIEIQKKVVELEAKAASQSYHVGIEIYEPAPVVVFGHTLNRTMLELKWPCVPACRKTQPALNRTMLELK